MSAAKAEVFIELLREQALLVSAEKLSPGVCRDPRRPITSSPGDKDLHDTVVVVEYLRPHGVEVVTVRELVERLELT